MARRGSSRDRVRDCPLQRRRARERVRRGRVRALEVSRNAGGVPPPPEDPARARGREPAILERPVSKTAGRGRGPGRKHPARVLGSAAGPAADRLLAARQLSRMPRAISDLVSDLLRVLRVLSGGVGAPRGPGEIGPAPRPDLFVELQEERSRGPRGGSASTPAPAAVSVPAPGSAQTVRSPAQPAAVPASASSAPAPSASAEWKEQILSMMQAGVGVDVIAAWVASQPARPTLSADDVIDWKKAGIDEKVIQAALTR